MGLPKEILHYFDRAVVVDDELDLQKTPDETKDSIQLAATALFYRFQDEGIVVSPFNRLTKEEPDAMVKRAVKVIRPAKLLILDWHLNEQQANPSSEEGNKGAEVLDPPAGNQPSADADQLPDIEDLIDVANKAGKKATPHLGTPPVDDIPLEKRTELNQDAGSGSYMAKEIILTLLVDENPGLRFVVVYSKHKGTETDYPRELLGYLKKKLRDEVLLAEVDALLSTGAPSSFRLGSMFFTFMCKQPMTKEAETSKTEEAEETGEAERLFEKFAQRIQLISGPFTLAFLGSVSLLESATQRAVLEFAKPFDLPFLSHLRNNHLQGIPAVSFLVSMVRDFVFYYHQENPDFAAYLSSIVEKQSVLVKAIPGFVIDNGGATFKHWRELVQERAHLDELKRARWGELLSEIAPSATDLESLISAMDAVPNKLVYTEPGFSLTDDKTSAKVWEQLHVAASLTVAHLSWREQHPTSKLEDFFEDLRRQNILFTRLLKYTATKELQLPQTGAVYRRKIRPEEFLLCITPYCDTDKPHKVNYRYKFLVGQTQAYQLSKSGQEDLGSHKTYVPCNNDELQLVRWDFFHTRVFDLLPDANPLKDWHGKDFETEWLMAKEKRKAMGDLLEGRLSQDGQVALLKRWYMSEIEKDARRKANAGAKPNEAPNPEAPAAAASEAPADPAGPTEGDQKRWKQNAIRALKDLMGDSYLGNGEDLFSQAQDLSEDEMRNRLSELIVGKHKGFHTDFEFVANLKREYIQQILNKYLIYQSRAGVNELYFKENPGYLIHLLDPTR